MVNPRSSIVISYAPIAKLADGIAIEFTFRRSLFSKAEAHSNFWNLDGILMMQAFQPPLREIMKILILFWCLLNYQSGIARISICAIMS
jgi:hypothetical protein